MTIIKSNHFDKSLKQGNFNSSNNKDLKRFLYSTVQTLKNNFMIITIKKLTTHYFLATAPSLFGEEIN